MSVQRVEARDQRGTDYWTVQAVVEGPGSYYIVSEDEVRFPAIHGWRCFRVEDIKEDEE